MSERRFQTRDRVRYTGNSANLRGHIGTIGYYHWNDQWVIYWERPYPASPRYGYPMTRSRPIRGDNLILVVPGQSSHGLWVA